MPCPLDDETALRPGIEPGTAGLEGQPGILTAEHGGAGGNRTLSCRFCRPTPSHLATAPILCSVLPRISGIRRSTTITSTALTVHRCRAVTCWLESALLQCFGMVAPPTEELAFLNLCPKQTLSLQKTVADLERPRRWLYVVELQSLSLATPTRTTKL